jgi:hypothetical protein
LTASRRRKFGGSIAFPWEYVPDLLFLINRLSRSAICDAGITMPTGISTQSELRTGLILVPMLQAIKFALPFIFDRSVHKYTFSNCRSSMEVQCFLEAI